MQKSRELQIIEKYMQGNKQSTKKLIEIFIRQTSQEIKDLQTCLVNKDWREIKEIAHKMKSAFLYLDMPRPIELTEYLRKKAGTNITASIEHINELSEICLQLINSFKKELKKL
jgi:HPt (histidine-containing phosphotransfer) domain-containing protein